MALITLSRREWAAVLDELNRTERDDRPPGLGERIAELLSATPDAWPDQACNLELSDLAAVALVQSLVRRGLVQPVRPDFLWQEEASVAEAEQIIRDHQDRITED